MVLDNVIPLLEKIGPSDKIVDVLDFSLKNMTEGYRKDHFTIFMHKLMTRWKEAGWHSKSPPTGLKRRRDDHGDEERLIKRFKGMTLEDQNRVLVDNLYALLYCVQKEDPQKLCNPSVPHHENEKSFEIALRNAKASLMKSEKKKEPSYTHNRDYAKILIEKFDQQKCSPQPTAIDRKDSGFCSPSDDFLTSEDRETSLSTPNLCSLLTPKSSIKHERPKSDRKVRFDDQPQVLTFEWVPLERVNVLIRSPFFLGKKRQPPMRFDQLHKLRHKSKTKKQRPDVPVYP